MCKLSGKEIGDTFFSNVINGEKGNDGGRMEFGEIFDYCGIDGIEIEKVGEEMCWDSVEKLLFYVQKRDWANCR